ncbi:MAG: restriction endonuclease [Candidatus Thermoplasmatota archaeon]|nr:restriction endonuclease [Euryarchaeota archaeon]MBU4072490.1 restriction endonuclease [Candidatus Thermoplasmatota archaeon]MBU4591570.1 restriction endonuclease [Candidatus Thermoplasmatota archaeon]
MSKVEDAISILKDMGLPKSQQNERSGLTLLALLDLKIKDPWSKSKKRAVRIHDILVFVQKNYNKQYAENTRETIRRQTIHQFEQAGIVIRNSDDPFRPTNSPNTVYIISDEALNTIKGFGTGSWKRGLNKFISKQGRLVDKYEKRKKSHVIPVDLPDGIQINFTPGKHNELQAKILIEFRSRFCYNTSVVYVGDAAKKMLFLDESILRELKIPITQHDKLPDIVLYDEEKNNLILIEAVTSHGPLSPKRHIELEKTLAKSGSRRIYISAFPNFKEFKKHIDNIAWDTEVWIEDNPDHMIHFNGPKFFTVYDN